MDAKRYIPHPNEPPSDLLEAEDDILAALISNLQRLQRHPSPGPGVYLGNTGMILVDSYISAVLPSLDLPKAHANPRILTMPLFSTPRTGAQASFLETSVGPATLALVQTLRGDTQEHGNDRTWEGCVQLLDSALQVAIREDLDDDGCEVLYGRAGLLYALLLLRSELAMKEGSSLVHDAVTKISAEDNIQALMDDIVRRGRLGAKEYSKNLENREQEHAPPLMWSWHGKRYLGAAHGVAGILQMMLSLPTRILIPYWPDILGTIQWLLEVQEPLGNWPSKTGRHMARQRVSVEDNGGNSLVQWCHGAPGVLIMLSCLLRRAGCQEALPTTLSNELHESATAALKRGGEFVYTRGLLRKGVGLCHGTAGSVYALLAVADVLDGKGQPEPYWLTRAADLAVCATAYRKYEQKGEMRVPDRPYSLYEGVAGMCCAWADVLARLQADGTADRSSVHRRRGMPGYDDLAVE